mmetsp:Transcript_24153/g.45981  ORF Transcript_24153/g.45981 Transcript_24153/m.45981 type:complete len:233 (+) Transcript_24153:1085-1783(+)
MFMRLAESVAPTGETKTSVLDYTSVVHACILLGKVVEALLIAMSKLFRLGNHFILEGGSFGSLALGLFRFGHAFPGTEHHVVLELFNHILLGVGRFENGQMFFGLGQELVLELGQVFLLASEPFEVIDMFLDTQKQFGLVGREIRHFGGLLFFFFVTLVDFADFTMNRSARHSGEVNLVHGRQLFFVGEYGSRGLFGRSRCASSKKRLPENNDGRRHEHFWCANLAPKIKKD